MKSIDELILKQLARPQPDSHKGQNGRVLVIAGSEKFHGALLLTVQAASRIVDMVYVHSIKDNLKLVKKLKSEIATFIAVQKDELFETIDIMDTIIMGPGLPESSETIALVHEILSKYPNKKTIVDATALWHVKPECLHKNCVVTPHSREFENVFKCHATPENVKMMAEKYSCIIVLTGGPDYISDGKELWKNEIGNVGMTKGGTGDVLAGLIGSLAATNDLITATLAGVYLNGFAGDKLYEEVGTFYNAEDLIWEMGEVWKELM